MSDDIPAWCLMCFAPATTTEAMVQLEPPHEVHDIDLCDECAAKIKRVREYLAARAALNHKGTDK